MNSEDAKLVKEVLRAGIDATAELPQQLTTLVSLHDMINNADYLNQVMFKYEFSQDALGKAANELYTAAVRWYNMREYARAYDEIIDKALATFPLAPLSVKLLTASIQCLGYFAIAAGMYRKYFELENDVDSLFYSGLCYYCTKQHDLAVENFIQFVELVSSSVQLSNKHNVICTRAKTLLEQLQSTTQ